MQQKSSVKKKSIHGLFWSFLDLIGNQGIQFIIQIILARILLPEHFGLIGMILIFIAISNSLIDSGFTQALIREQNVTQTDYSTVFYFNIFISLILYLILYISAPLVSNFFEQSQLVDLLRVLSLVILINASSIIPRAMLTKEINFKIQMKVNMSATIISGLIAVILALNGYGVWSLVIQTVIKGLIQSVLLLLNKKWIPSLEFSVESFKNLFGFGWKLMISGLIDTLYKNSYFIIIGKQYSAGQLGYYTNASRMRDMISHTLTSTIQRVTYPLLSTMQSEEERLKIGYVQIIKLSATVMFPLMIGLAAIGSPLVNVVFGEKWMPMVLYFQLLCFGGMLYPIHAINLNILKVKGRSDLFLYLEIIKKLSLTILIFLALWLQLGIVGLIGAAITNSYLSLFVNTYFSAKEISYPIKEQLIDLLPVYFISIAMGIVVAIVGEVFSTYNILELGIQISVGIILYVILCKLFKIKELETMFNLISPYFKKINLFKRESLNSK